MARSNRPFSRSLIKLGFRILLGPSRAHVQDWFPGLQLALPSGTTSGQIAYRGRQVAPLLSADVLLQRSGDAIYVVGSGPSISGNDLSRIAPSSAILLNGAIHLIGNAVADPLAVAIEDERFVWRHFDVMRRYVRPGTICLLSVAVIRAVCEQDPAWLRERTVVLIDDVRAPYRGRLRSVSEVNSLGYVRTTQDGSAGFSVDPDRGVFKAGSVAVSATQFAFHCRPGRIGFFGIDISNADSPRFYEAPGQSAFSGIARAEARILASFALARTIAEELGIELVNFSPVSALSKCGIRYDERYAIAAPSGGRTG